MESTDTPPKAHHRRWPRRLAIGAGIVVLVLGGAYWYLGRESTLQMIAQRVAKASGGKLALAGVSGSLYGKMHADRLVYTTETQRITVNNVDIDWSPWQFASSGLQVNKLAAASARIETLRDSKERTPAPASLAPPFQIDVDEARIGKALFVNQGAVTPIDNIRLGIHGDKQRWVLRDAAAATPWGQVAASATVGATRPFKLDASASFSESRPPVGRAPAQLKLRAGGNLLATSVDLTGQAGRAQGEARFQLAPFAEIPLRALTLHARNLNPGFFNPSLPSADLTLEVAARLDQARKLSGKVALENSGSVGPLDQQRLPLRALHAQLGGNLERMRATDVVIDLGPAGGFTGSGSIEPGRNTPGPASAAFALHTDRLDLSRIVSSMKPTTIAGDVKVATEDGIQAFDLRLAERNMHLLAHATLANDVVTLTEARLAAGKGSVSAHGTLALAGDKPFQLQARSSHFNPAALGDLPAADINASVTARGAMAPEWRLGARFAISSSRLMGQPLSGKGELDANARHISGVDAALSFGRNLVSLNGSFGAPGERLRWRLDGNELDVLRSDLYGSLVASGALTGTMAEPRTSFEVVANGLGWVPAQRKKAGGQLRASGEAWLAGAEGQRVVQFKADGSTSKLNPAAFGAPMAGSVNSRFDASGSAGKGWRGALDLTVQQSTLSQSPFWGHAKLVADDQHVASSDVELHVGANVATAHGGFGSPSDKLDWRIDAPQLGALGPEFGGQLRGGGSVSGTAKAPGLSANLAGQGIRLPGKFSVGTLRAEARLGSGRGNDDALVADIQASALSSGDARVAALRLQASGTRAAHAVQLSARGDEFDLDAAVRGLWSDGTWNGTVTTLRNRGRFAFALQEPTPLRIAAEPGSGFSGLLHPTQLALNGAVLRLPSGSITVESLAKIGPLWNSRGSATGVPLTYLAQFSPALAGEIGGDLTLGAQWQLDLRAASASGAAPALDGVVRVFREGGDARVGSEVPVTLGLRQLEARAEVSGGALRVRADIDGARTGQAHLDANAELLQGRLAPDSPLRVSARGDMPSIAWLAPLTGQPGLELDGALRFALAGGGTVGDPRVSGNVTGDALAVTWAAQGVRLRNGQLRAELTGDQLHLQRLAFDGREGSARVDGTIRFAGPNADVRLHAVADHLEALSRPDRTVVVTGEATLVREAKRFDLDGNFLVNRALIEMAPQGGPTMSDDVIVLGRDSVPKPGAGDGQDAEVPLNVMLVADLGDDFRVRGMGLDATLTGKLRLRKVGERPPRVNGTIRVVNGTYEAYGQKLAIDRGVITFSGPYDNPSLNILAVRKRPEGEQLSELNVEAGVQVRGTALAPTAKLVSKPNVSDSEKLSWLVLGHGMEAATGNEAELLSTAASALLGGRGGGGGIKSKIANSLGVDEIGLSQAEGLESTVVTVGKRISSRAYLSFAQGASSATSVVRLRYKLNPRITLQFQTGTNTALDILYSWAFD